MIRNKVCTGQAKYAKSGKEKSPPCDYRYDRTTGCKYTINGIYCMQWKVYAGRRVQKQVDALPKRVRDSLLALTADIELHGPVRGNWPNYGKLAGGRHHCHIRKGRPTYVAVWEERDKTVRIIEVTYAGTHEKAPY